MAEVPFFKVEIFLEGHLKMIFFMGLLSTLEKIINNIKVNGNRIKNMVMEFLSFQMDLCTKENIKTDKEKERGIWYMQMEMNMKGSGLMEKSMEREDSNQKRKILLESGRKEN